MTEKKCKDCGNIKPVEEFYFCNTKKRHFSRCKLCYSEHRKPLTLKYYTKNKEKIDKNSSEYRKANKHLRKKYYEKNKEKLNASNRASYLKYRDVNIQKRKDWYIENKESHAKAREKYFNENKDRLRAARRKWENERLLNDVSYRLKKNLSGRIRSEVKGVYKKTSSTEQILGCTISELKIYLESKFKEGMTWNNWSTEGWHLDHKIPLSWFNLESESCRKLAFHYSNLQPLWSEENLNKKNRFSHTIYEKEDFVWNK